MATTSSFFSFASFDFNGFYGCETEGSMTIRGRQQADQHVFGMQEQDQVPTTVQLPPENATSKPLQQQQDTFMENSSFPERENKNLAQFKNEQLVIKPITNEMPSLTGPSWELLGRSRFRKMRTITTAVSNATSDDQYCHRAGSQNRLSTEEIMRIAGARYLQFCNLQYDDFSMVMHPFGHALVGLSNDQTKDVELVHLLLAAAEKVGHQQPERAYRLLSRCEWISSDRSNPVQRIVYYFAEALRERIDKESPRELGIEKDNTMDHGLGTNVTSVMLHQKLPFLQVLHFAGIQAIAENVESVRKIHAVDLEIRSGVQWTIFMQAIAERSECPVELLTITAVDISGKDKPEEIRNRLESVAESLRLPFSFKVVRLADIKLGDKGEQLFNVKDDESVVVYAPLILRTMIARPSSLEDLMKVIKSWNPSVMVVVEVEANHNSASFVNRFVEALFFYSALFDCVEACIAQDKELKARTESTFFTGIRSMVVAEGADRVTRSVKMEVWRAFFTRFEMAELGFSESSMYQANLVIKRFACSAACSLDRNEKSIVVGWKGTPIHSVSAWKFSKERGRLFGNY